jgi:XTP/dITP diphosphohydrolase
MKLVFVTGNEGKFREARAMLSKHGIELERTDMEIDEIQDRDVEKVARVKAKFAYSVLKRPLFVEDTGLCIGAMNGYPGNLIKHFLSAIGMEGILKCMEGRPRSAEGVSVVAYADGNGRVKTFVGKVKGKISDYVGKGYDFGWDTIFIPSGHEKTFAELGMKEKNKVSHRKKSVEKFAEWLKENPR